MERSASANRRRYVRYPLATTVQFYHGPSRRAFPARTVDISSGGLLMHVPASTPVAPGQPIRLTLGNHEGCEAVGLDGGPIHATIVRVDRRGLLDQGHLPVGVRFARQGS